MSPTSPVRYEGEYVRGQEVSRGQSNGTSTYHYYGQSQQSPEPYSPSSEHFYDRIQSMGETNHGDAQDYEVPPASVLLEEYKTNPLSVDHRSISRDQRRLNEDPMTMHFLIETAINDSQDYQILSIEELDALKMEQRSLRRKNEALRSKLQLEIRVRDSAQALVSLFPDQDVAAPKRRSLLGSRSSGGPPRSPSFQKSKDELARSVRLCDELAREIWICDRRQRELEDTQLRHTAGVFQAQHQLLLQEQGAAKDAQNGGYEDDNYGNSISNGTGAYDDGIMDIPQRHSVLNRELVNQHTDLMQQREALAQTEARLQDFHERLRDVVAKYSEELPLSDKVEFHENDTSAAISKHLDFMEHGLGLIENAPVPSQDNGSNTKVGQLSNLLYEVLDESNVSETPVHPPSQDQLDISGGLSYLEEGLRTLQQNHLRLHDHVEDLQSRGMDNEQEMQRWSDALHRLWDTLVSGEERLAQSRTRDSEDESPFGYDAFDEDQKQGTTFSVVATLTKTQRLCDRAARLFEQQAALRDQLHQEQERSLKTESMLVAEREKMTTAQETLQGQRNDLLEELQATREQHLTGQKAYKHKQSLLDDVKAELEQALEELKFMKQRQDVAASEELDQARAEYESTMQELNAQLNARTARISDLEDEVTSHAAHLESAHAAHQDAVTSRGEILEELQTTRATHEDIKQNLISQLSAKMAQIDDLEDARAAHAVELESAQGAHRNAETARNDALEKLETTRSAYESTKQDFIAQMDAKMAQIEELENALTQHTADLQSAQAAYQDAEASRNILSETLTQRESILSALQESHSTTTLTLQEAQAQIIALSAALATHESTLGTLTSEKSALEADVAHLTTAATLARAELDAAHGTRAQRAADTPVLRRQLDELTARNADLTHHVEALKFHGERTVVLERELAELVDEYETLVQHGVAAERDRQGLEGALDAARVKVEALEVRLGEERVRVMGGGRVGSAAVNSHANGVTDVDAGADRRVDGTVINVMRSEFKKMMREARAEQFRALKTEQEERRRLEATIRALRKDPGALGSVAPTPQRSDSLAYRSQPPSRLGSLRVGGGLQ